MGEDAKPRDVQHGVEEITRRFDERRVGMDRWAAALVAASKRPEDPVRNVAAWGMGFDAGRAEFVARLRELAASDSSVLVRRNAACSLANAGDASGRASLRAMLEPFVVTAPVAGILERPAAIELPVRENKDLVCAVRRDDGTVADVLSPVPGRVTRRIVAEGARVAVGDGVIELAPDAKHAANAAAALARVGTKDDVELLDLAGAPRSTFPDDVKSLARAAADAIRARVQ